MLVGCQVTGKEKVGKVMITEIEKNRTHTFEHYSDGTRTILIGNFNINGKDWPGRILYDGNNSYLYKPNPDECIKYDGYEVIYGYLPISAVIEKSFDKSINVSDKNMDVSDESAIVNDESVNVIVLAKKDDMPIKYKIQYGEGKESIVEYENNDLLIDPSLDQDVFSLAANISCIRSEDFLLNVR